MQISTANWHISAQSKRHSWLPPGKRAGICFSVDDIRPCADDVNGNIGNPLAPLEWLLRRHPLLRCTLFVTPDWRLTNPRRQRLLWPQIPYIKRKVFYTRVLPRGTLSLVRHPDFVAYIKSLPRTEVALHGLHHVQRGRNNANEFAGLDAEACGVLLDRSICLFREANLPFIPGLCPPAWACTPSLEEAMRERGLSFVASARDLTTAVSSAAKSDMTGIKGVSLVYPDILPNSKLIHFTTNFQATSAIDRALEIVEVGGLLSIKAHMTKNMSGHIQLDGLDDLYRNYLDSVCLVLRARFGDGLWWTSMGQIASRMRTLMQ